MSRHRFTASVRVTARQMHSGEIIMTNLRIFIDHRGRHIHSLPTASELQKMRRRFVSQSARPEMHAHPDAILLVGEKIDIVVSPADRSELVLGHRFQPAHWFQLPLRIIKQLMFHPRFALAANPKRNLVYHVVHDLVDLRRNLLALCVRQDSKISTGDIETDTAQRNFILVGNDTTDGLRVSFMPIRAKHATLPALRNASIDLIDRCLVMLAEDFRPCFHRNSKLKGRGD